MQRSRSDARGDSSNETRGIAISEADTVKSLRILKACKAGDLIKASGIDFRLKFVRFDENHSSGPLVHVSPEKHGLPLTIPWLLVANHTFTLEATKAEVLKQPPRFKTTVATPLVEPTDMPAVAPAETSTLETSESETASKTPSPMTIEAVATASDSTESERTHNSPEAREEPQSEPGYSAPEAHVQQSTAAIAEMELETEHDELELNATAQGGEAGESGALSSKDLRPLKYSTVFRTGLGLYAHIRANIGGRSGSFENFRMGKANDFHYENTEVQSRLTDARWPTWKYASHGPYVVVPESQAATDRPYISMDEAASTLTLKKIQLKIC